MHCAYCGEGIEPDHDEHAAVAVTPINSELAAYQVKFCLECVAFTSKSCESGQIDYDDWITQS